MNHEATAATGALAAGTVHALPYWRAQRARREQERQAQARLRTWDLLCQVPKESRYDLECAMAFLLWRDRGWRLVPWQDLLWGALQTYQARLSRWLEGQD